MLEAGAGWRRYDGNALSILIVLFPHDSNKPRPQTESCLFSDLVSLLQLTHLCSYTNTAIGRNSTPGADISILLCWVPMSPHWASMLPHWASIGLWCFTIFYKCFMMFYLWFTMFYMVHNLMMYCKCFMMFYECFAMFYDV